MSSTRSHSFRPASSSMIFEASSSIRLRYASAPRRERSRTSLRSVCSGGSMNSIMFRTLASPSPDSSMWMPPR